MSKTYTITSGSSTGYSGALTSGSTTSTITINSSDITSGSTIWVDGQQLPEEPYRGKWASPPPKPKVNRRYRDDYYDDEWGSWA